MSWIIQSVQFMSTWIATIQAKDLIVLAILIVIILSSAVKLLCVIITEHGKNKRHRQKLNFLERIHGDDKKDKHDVESTILGETISGTAEAFKEEFIVDLGSNDDSNKKSEENTDNFIKVLEKINDIIGKK